MKMDEVVRKKRLSVSVLVLMKVKMDFMFSSPERLETRLRALLGLKWLLMIIDENKVIQFNGSYLPITILAAIFVYNRSLAPFQRKKKLMDLNN
jgi:hypothetical protein